MKKIVVGLGFSEYAAQLLKFAFKMAQFNAAKVTIAYVMAYKEFDSDNPNANFRGDDYERHRVKQEKRLMDFVQPFLSKQYHDLEIDYVVKYGYSSEELALIAQEENADLLMLGKETKSGNFFFKDTSNHLIQNAPCPIFIVPEGAEFQSFNRIIYASDFILEDCEAILHLQDWIKNFKAELIGLHICQDKEAEQKAKKKMELLKKLFPQENISFRTAIADVEKGIDRYVQLSKSDLVAMTHRKRNFWDGLFKRSMSKAIAYDVEVPMIIFQQQ